MAYGVFYYLVISNSSCFTRSFGSLPEEDLSSASTSRHDSNCLESFSSGKAAAASSSRR